MVQTIGETREAMTKDILDNHIPRIANQYRGRFKYMWVMVNMEEDIDTPGLFRQALGVTNVKPQPKYGMFCIRVNTENGQMAMEWNIPKNKTHSVLPDECYSNVIVPHIYDTVLNLPKLIG